MSIQKITYVGFCLSTEEYQSLFCDKSNIHEQQTAIYNIKTCIFGLFFFLL